jgi:phosphoribosylamine---glycine ligase
LKQEMHFLGVGEDMSLGDMYLRLAAAGHAVKAYASDPNAADVMRGMVERTPDWQRDLNWVREAGTNGVILFETATKGEVQDALRRDGFNVIGGSTFGDKLELDREGGQAALRSAGLKTAACVTFSDFQSGIDFVRRHPKRYVFKLNGAGFSSGRNYVGRMEDGADIVALLSRHRARWHLPVEPSFILMDHLEGVEVGVGGYFNGERFMDPVVIDFEHKHFFDGDLGELTGEMGTLVSYENSRPLFEATLAKMAPQLKDGGYVGYINLNTIVNEAGIWPLELTSRFGYPGFAICDALHAEGWDMLFQRMIAHHRTDFATHPGFAVGVVLTVPPFPQTDRYDQLSKGLPILFRGELSAEDRKNLHFAEVELADGQLLTSGEMGYLMVATGRGATPEAARDKAYRLTRRVVVPNLRYRADIGIRFIENDRRLLNHWGLWPDAVQPA